MQNRKNKVTTDLQMRPVNHRHVPEILSRSPNELPTLVHGEIKSRYNAWRFAIGWLTSMSLTSCKKKVSPKVWNWKVARFWTEEVFRKVSFWEDRDIRKTTMIASNSSFFVVNNSSDLNVLRKRVENASFSNTYLLSRLLQTMLFPHSNEQEEEPSSLR